MGAIGYIIFFGVMFWMMRKGGGCCGGGHRGHSSSSTKQYNHDNYSKESNKSDSETIEMVYDPVCGMHVEKNNVVTRVINGKKYYFCSESCAENFR